MKKLLFLLSLVVITLSSCSTKEDVTKGSTLPYEIVQLAEANIGDSVLLINTEKYDYIVRNGVITEKYDVREEWVFGGAVVVIMFASFLIGLAVGAITS